MRPPRGAGPATTEEANHGIPAATGNTDTPGGTEYEIKLTITPVGGEAYEVTTNQFTYPSNPFTQGENVTVKVDPDDREVLMIFGHA